MKQRSQTTDPVIKPSAASPAEAGEQMDVRATHAAIMREHAEPVEGREPTPLWLITLIAVLVFGSGFYMARYSGGFQPLVFDENPSQGVTLAAKPAGPVDMAALGRRTFQNNCQTCHQESGSGLAGQYPPLAGSEWVLSPDASRIIRVVLDGFHGPVSVKGQSFNNLMVPWREVLSDQQIAAALTYIRQAWGNKAPPVTEAEVKAIREQTKARTGTPWTVPELQKVSLKE